MQPLHALQPGQQPPAGDQQLAVARRRAAADVPATRTPRRPRSPGRAAPAAAAGSGRPVRPRPAASADRVRPAPAAPGPGSRRCPDGRWLIPSASTKCTPPGNRSRRRCAARTTRVVLPSPAPPEITAALDRSTASSSASRTGDPRQFGGPAGEVPDRSGQFAQAGRGREVRRPGTPGLGQRDELVPACTVELQRVGDQDRPYGAAAPAPARVPCRSAPGRSLRTPRPAPPGSSRRRDGPGAAPPQRTYQGPSHRPRLSWGTRSLPWCVEAVSTRHQRQRWTRHGYPRGSPVGDTPEQSQVRRQCRCKRVEAALVSEIRTQPAWRKGRVTACAPWGQKVTRRRTVH